MKSICWPMLDYFQIKKSQILTLIIAILITICGAINSTATSVIMLSDEDLIVSVRANTPVFYQLNSNNVFQEVDLLSSGQV